MNPLDPSNPHTGGAPPGFEALAENGAVSLRWVAASTVPIDGYRLERRVANAPDFSTLAELPPGVDGYFDSGLADGVDHAYRLRFILSDGTLGPAAEDIATPGPARPWVADEGGAVVRVAPDARRAADDFAGAPFREPFAVDVNPLNGHAYVCDPAAGALFDVTTPFTVSTIGALQEPVAVAVNRVTGLVWVCDDVLDAVQAYLPSSPGVPVANVTGLATPLSVAIDPNDGSVWVCERTGDRVRHLSGNGVGLGATPVLEPSHVAIDSATRRVWVTSLARHQLTVLTAGGTPIDSVTTLAGPTGVAVDARAGRIWVADVDGDQVIAYDRSLVEKFRVRLPSPRDVAIDPRSGEAWVALPTTGQVARVSPAGAVLRLLGGLAAPYAVAVDVGASTGFSARSRSAPRR